MRLMYLSTVLAALTLAGCPAPPGPSLRELAIDRPDDADGLVAVQLGNDTVSTGAVRGSGGSVSLDRLGPPPALARAVQPGVAKPSRAITTERYTQWLQKADLRVRLERQKARLLYLQDLLRLAKTSEADYIERLTVDHLRIGYSPDEHLRIFGLVRNRLRDEIKRTETEIRLLGQALASTEPLAVDTNLFSSDPTTLEKTLSAFGLARTEIAKLDQIGIHGLADFLEHFYLPDQHEVVATLLGRDLESVRALISEMAKPIRAWLPAMMAGCRRPARLPRSGTP